MGEIAPEEQFLHLSTVFYYQMLDFYVERGIRFSLRDKRLFEITEVEITRVDCISFFGSPLRTGISETFIFVPDCSIHVYDNRVSIPFGRTVKYTAVKLY